MIRATYSNEHGQAEAQVIDANLENHTAMIELLGQRLSGYWWDEPKQLTVSRDDLSNIRVDCACGVERCPDDPCCWNCGECWREPKSDEQDIQETQDALREEIR